jgi:hypothetical protein
MMYLTFLAAFMLSSIAAYYSIVGLTTIFMGAFWPIVIMGVALELAKLVTTSWLYQNWKVASWLLKTYLTIAVMMLMLITSMGVFGFLAKSYIDSTQGNKTNATDIATLNTQESIAKARLDYLLARAKDPATASPYLDRQIQDTQKELSHLSKTKSPLLQQENKLIADVGPLVYIAEIFYDDSVGSVDKAVRLVIMLIMFVFDPLAILLLIAANTLLKEQRIKSQPEATVITSNDARSYTAKPDQNKNTPVSRVAVSQAAIAPNQSAETTLGSSNQANSSPDQAENERQLATLLMTNNDIAAAYKLFLGRAPTVQDDPGRFQGTSSKQLLEAFYNSPEFLARSGADKLILKAANRIEILKKSRSIQ